MQNHTQHTLHTLQQGLLLIILALALTTCAISSILPPEYTGPERSFTTGFETQDDFSGFYIVPPGDYDSYHELSTDQRYKGSFSHKAWITSARAKNNDGTYRPHRAYPSVQLYKTSNGSFRTPALISLWVYVDIELSSRSGIDDWLSLVTLSPDSSDHWSRTVLVNLTTDGYLRLVHVPRQGEQTHIFQITPGSDEGGTLAFPKNQWVRLDVFIDFDPETGYAKLWQDGTLISHARVEGGARALAQAHFGLYAAAALSSGTVFNDQLRIIEVADEQAAIPLVEAEW